MDAGINRFEGNMMDNYFLFLVRCCEGAKVDNDQYEEQRSNHFGISTYRYPSILRQFWSLSTLCDWQLTLV